MGWRPLEADNQQTTNYLILSNSLLVEEELPSREGGRGTVEKVESQVKHPASSTPEDVKRFLEDPLALNERFPDFGTDSSHLCAPGVSSSKDAGS